jgi:hypothetical protein
VHRPGRCLILALLTVLLAACGADPAARPSGAGAPPAVDSSASAQPQDERGADGSGDGDAVGLGSVAAADPTVAGTATTAPRHFSFAAAGDLGANRTTARSLAALDRSTARFFVALGDLDYDQTASDAAWCRYVTNRLPEKGPRYPFELLVGNHEADGGPDGRIRRHAACLPDRLDSHGKYARQYAFTFPRTDPYAKLIMVAPQIRAGGHTYRYGAGTADREWLVQQIDRARAQGIEWVIVGMHMPCLSTGAGHPDCSSGHAIHNLVLQKKVDLLMTGHNHVYERSKQLALSDGCLRIPDGYDERCVVDAGEDGSYLKGAGTVQVTSGRFGGRPMDADPSDPDAGYFVVVGDRTTGFTKYTVSPDRLVARYVASTGTLADTFVIEAAG